MYEGHCQGEKGKRSISRLVVYLTLGRLYLGWQTHGQNERVMNCRREKVGGVERSRLKSLEKNRAQ